MLSPVLAGEKSFDEIVINDEAWYVDNGIALLAGEPVVAIDRGGAAVVAADGSRTPYDRLLIATGSDPFIIPVPGKDLPGVRHLPRPRRCRHDARRGAQRGKNAVVIGGGLLGLEAAHGLLHAGHEGHRRST